MSRNLIQNYIPSHYHHDDITASCVLSEEYMTVFVILYYKYATSSSDICQWSVWLIRLEYISTAMGIGSRIIYFQTWSISPWFMGRNWCHKLHHTKFIGLAEHTVNAVLMEALAIGLSKSPHRSRDVSMVSVSHQQCKLLHSWNGTNP
jgi:hypothetical protein